MSICILLQKYRYWSTNACNFYVPILSFISVSFSFLGIITRNLFYMYLYIYNRPQVISILVKLFYCGSLQRHTNFYSWLTPQQQLDCCRLCSSPRETPIQIFNGWCRRLRLVQNPKGPKHTLLLQYLPLSIWLWSLKHDLKNYGSNSKDFDQHGPKFKIMESCISIDRMVSWLAWSLSEAQLVKLSSIIEPIDSAQSLNNLLCLQSKSTNTT